MAHVLLGGDIMPRSATSILCACLLVLGAACGIGGFSEGYTPFEGEDDADGDADADLYVPPGDDGGGEALPLCDPATCDDGDPCNGVESCVDGACVAGEAPNLDADRDGHERADCGGDDCDDRDADARPGGEEVCFDGADNDCNGTVDDGSCARRGEVCTDPIPIRIPAGAAVEKDFWLDLEGFADDHNFGDAAHPWPDCTPGADCCPWESVGPEAVYRLELGGPTTLRLDFTSDLALAEPLDFVVYIRSTCSAAETLECWDDLSDAGDDCHHMLVNELDLAAGTYFLFVDAFERDDLDPDSELVDPDDYRLNLVVSTVP